MARDLAGRGIPYVWGGKTLAGFDCSGLVYYILRELGISDLYRIDTALRSWTTPIADNAARPGDLIFWPGHVAIFVGNGRIVDAGSSVYGVTERALWPGGTYGRIP